VLGLEDEVVVRAWAEPLGQRASFASRFEAPLDDGRHVRPPAAEVVIRVDDRDAHGLRPSLQGGKPVGGVQELDYKAGEQIRFVVQSDTADEVHVHGYDVEEEVKPGRPAVFDFPADIEGIFEGELHGSGEQIVELRVEP